MKTMSLNIKDYVKIYDNFLDAKLCKNLVKELKDADWQLHTYYDPKTNMSKSYEKELSVSYIGTSELGRNVNDQIWFVLQKYITDFPEMHEWFTGWSGYTQVRFNRYDKNTQMRLHCDHIHSIFDGARKGVPTLTVLGGLNENYSGGELILWEQEKIELKAGSIMVFPSNFLYPHRVVEITKGTRYSFVSWAW